MSFRQYGGINYAARNNIVKNNYTNANNLSVMAKVGQPDSIINVDSGLYGIAGDITFKYLATPYYGIKFSDGTTQRTAITTTDTYWQPYELAQDTPIIYYTNRVIIGADPNVINGTIDDNTKLAVNGNIAANGNFYAGYLNNSGSVNNTFSVEGSTGNTSISGNVGIGTSSPSKKLEVSGSDALINSLTVGNGTGSIGSNTAVGFQALYGNNSGNGGNSAIGYLSLKSNTSGYWNTALGYSSLTNNTTGYSNTALGFNALISNYTGNNNTSVGRGALENNTVSDNTAVGYYALQANTSGTHNVAVGSQALQTNSSSGDNVAVGFQALLNSSGSTNIGIGSYVLSKNTGKENIAIGNKALDTKTSGDANVGIGCYTIGHGTTDPTVSNNVAVGNYSLNFLSGNTTRNTAVGDEAGRYTTTGGYNTFLGYHSGYSNTSGTYNTYLGYLTDVDVSGNDLNYSTAIGANAKITATNQIVLGGSKNGVYPTVYVPGNLGIGTVNPGKKLEVFGSDALINGLTVGKGGGNIEKNTAFGIGSLNSNNIKSGNTAVGYQSLYSNINGVNNTAVGYQSLYSNDADYNTAFGESALYSNTSGDSNTAIGLKALWYNTTGVYNVAVGRRALAFSDGGDGGNSGNGSYNASVGNYSLYLNKNGSYNIAVGGNSLYNNIDGSNNVAIGYESGLTNTTGSNNTYIGYQANCSGNSFSNSTAIGAKAKITATNQIVLGGSINGVYPNVYVPGKLGIANTDPSYNLDVTGNMRVTDSCTALSFTAISDYRIKENVLTLDTTFIIDNLRPVTYTNKLSGKQDMGFIAHELQEHYPFLVIGDKDGEKNQSVNYIGLIALLVKEIQELKKSVELLKQIK